MTEHRASERSLYDRLQLPENEEARDLLERLLADPTNTYDRICIVLKSSGLFEDLKDVTPQDLSRYRQRKGREGNRASVMRLIEEEGETLLNAAAANPSGMVASYLRKMLTEHAVARFDQEIEGLDPLEVSREAARHALVEQRDRKLDLDEGKIELERKKVGLAERQADLAKDKFNIAAQTWKYILSWFAKEDARVADALTRASDKLLPDLEVFIETNG